MIAGWPANYFSPIENRMLSCTFDDGHFVSIFGDGKKLN